MHENYDEYEIRVYRSAMPGDRFAIVRNGTEIVRDYDDEDAAENALLKLQLSGRQCKGCGKLVGDKTHKCHIEDMSIGIPFGKSMTTKEIVCDENVVFCIDCGESGATLGDDAVRFCNYCGQRFTFERIPK